MLSSIFLVISPIYHSLLLWLIFIVFKLSVSMKLNIFKVLDLFVLIKTFISLSIKATFPALILALLLVVFS